MGGFRRFIKTRSAREKLFLVLLALVGLFYGGLQIYQYWTPDRTVQSQHYKIDSTETEEVTQEAARMAESLFACYRDTLGSKVGFEVPEASLYMRLYKNREEFKRCNILVPGYAEAVYRGKTCHQYYNEDEPNPWHWMLHEATHQLNREVAGLKLQLWLEEGLACYYSTNVVGKDGSIKLGDVDFNTYPIWWLDSLAPSGDWDDDLKSQKIIPLENIIKGNGPPVRKHVNTYYLHWWSLAHFLFHSESGKYRDGLYQLIEEGGSLEGFETYIGKLSEIEPLWYAYFGKWGQRKNPEKEIVFAYLTSSQRTAF